MQVCIDEKNSGNESIIFINHQKQMMSLVTTLYIEFIVISLLLSRDCSSCVCAFNCNYGLSKDAAKPKGQAEMPKVMNVVN